MKMEMMDACVYVCGGGEASEGRNVLTKQLEEIMINQN